jgi:DNA-binding CsgD family transcriptional regulator
MFAWQERDPNFTSGSLFRRGYLDDDVLDVLDAKDAKQLHASIQRYAWRAGFERFSILVIHDDLSTPTSGVVLSDLHNTPPDFLHEWGDAEACRVDPVMQQSKRCTAPFVYGQDTYIEAGQVSKWERQAPFGYANGICSIFHLPECLHIFFGIDRVRSLPSQRDEKARLVAQSHFFATFAQSAALALLRVDPAPSVRLSPREHECLQWAAEGKTAWETGMILSIAEGSVAKILASAIRKLDCASKPQAVVKALRLGLIH